METDVTSAQITSMGILSYLAESASHVTAPTTGTLLQKEIVMHTLENV